MTNNACSSTATPPWSTVEDGGLEGDIDSYPFMSEPNQMTSWWPPFPAVVDTSNPNLINSYTSNNNNGVHIPSYSEPIRSTDFVTDENFSWAFQMAETPYNNWNGDTNLASLPAETYNGRFGDQSYSDQRFLNNDYRGWFQQEHNYNSGGQILSSPATDVTWSMMNTGDNGNVNFNQNPKTLPRKVKNNKWSENEHRMFLAGVLDYGWGDWRSISRNVLSTRTASQIASHAQKYQLRQNIPEKSRKRKSIHDINKISYKSFTVTVLPTKISQSQ